MKINLELKKIPKGKAFVRFHVLSFSTGKAEGTISMLGDNFCIELPNGDSYILDTAELIEELLKGDK